MEYHVLSNNNMLLLLLYGVIVGAILGPIFSILGQRDASLATKEKGVLRKFMPWLILCILLSELSLLLYRYYDYPWNIEPQPSQASVFREMNYFCSGYPLWGWANDYQLPVISALTGSLMWLCWTVYAFNFEPSDTSWWKKACKVVAYLILSVFIYGFNLHELRDLWTYAGAIIVVAILLWIAKVRPSKEQSTNTNEEKVDIEEIAPSPIVSEPKNSEDPSRFMPKSSVVLKPQPTDNTETHSINEPVVSESVSESVSQESNIPQQIQEKVVEIKEEIADPPQQPVDNVVDIEMMYCKHCGKRIEADSTFCKYCGKRVK